MQNKITHTPTPWEVKDDVFIFQKDRFLLADLKNNPFEYETQMANAAYIVRAVNVHESLLTAVKIALEYLDLQNHPRNLQEQIAFREHQRDILRQAIAKAEGRQP